MPREMSSGFFIWRNRMSNAETKLWKLFFELEREVTRLEEENTSLKEKI
jgi:hypothetical protein